MTIDLLSEAVIKLTASDFCCR